mmetsp:Transcript_24791/g.37677  ORF Transcript_24791/g.37677 Transcript_24791/m.37677 type:complete len:458 (+) Transcript_24791:25-1398(+)
MASEESAEFPAKLPYGFKCTGNVKESHGKQIYCVTWSKDLFRDEGKKTYMQCFATCGGNTVSIYEVHNKEKPSFVLRQGYIDIDKSECFYACAFGGRCLGEPIEYGTAKYSQSNRGPGVNNNDSSIERPIRKRQRQDNNETIAELGNDYIVGNELYQSLINTDRFNGPQLLCVAGTGTTIKVIDVCRRMLYSTLSSHGDDIYDLKFSPTNEWLLLSASKDESLRMWNVKTSTCVAIFAGHEGHRDCILSVGWHANGNQFASGGMDTTVKLWDVGESDVHQAILRSQLVKPQRWDKKVDPNSKFRLIYEQMPTFSTNKVHTNYVDAVQYAGDLILSKDTHNTVVLWSPVINKSSRDKMQQRLPSEVIALREFTVNKCDVWFIRFSTDKQCQMLAIGNTVGEIKVWEIGTRPTKKHFANLIHQHCTSAIRMVAFNHDANYMVAVGDDATVWLWETILNR